MNKIRTVRPTKTTGQYRNMASVRDCWKLSHKHSPNRNSKKQGSYQRDKHHSLNRPLHYLLRPVDANRGCADCRIRR